MRRIKPLKPAPGDDARLMYVTPEVFETLRGAGSNGAQLPEAEKHITEQLILRFCMGHLMYVSLDGNSSKRSNITRMKNLDEVWALCARKPKMFQVRIFGRFLAQSVFVGLKLYQRGNLGNEKQYHGLASQTPEIWTVTVGDTEPLRADSAAGYVGRVVRDVAED